MPEGFFDDKTRDAVTQNKPTPAQVMDNELAAFSASIQDDLKASEEAEAELEEGLADRRAFEEGEEQDWLQFKVRAIREEAEKAGRVGAANGGGGGVGGGKKEDVGGSESDGDSDSSEGLDGLMDWRSKKL